jgi:hypothetical protein
MEQELAGRDAMVRVIHIKNARISLSATDISLKS